MNFIILVLCNTVTIYSFVEPFLTTYCIDVADFGNYEIHSVIYFFRNKQEGEMNMLKTAIEMDKAAIILKLLGDKTRLTMMKLMDDHACCVCEFVEIFQFSQPAISQHLPDNSHG